MAQSVDIRQIKNNFALQNTGGMSSIEDELANTQDNLLGISKLVGPTKQDDESLSDSFFMGKSEAMRPKSFLKSIREGNIPEINMSFDYKSAIQEAQHSYRNAPDIYRSNENSEDKDEKEGSDKDRYDSQEDEILNEHKLSYKKLMDFIAFNHPVNPVTKQRFSIMDRMSIKDFGIKILDCCCFFRVWQACGWGCKCLR